VDALLVLELLAAFGLPLGWGVWQWVSIRRERKRDRQTAAGSVDGQ
jgi:hypothetical protein